MRAKFRNEMIFLVLCTKKTKISAFKKYFLNLILVTEFIISRIAPHVILSRNCARIFKTCLCLSQKIQKFLKIKFF